ncbi:MAG TPA: hypothetical protein DC049_02035 [Spirochaetia bacterium]|nr:hypothetical protein [Spirochaetia bacterium]
MQDNAQILIKNTCNQKDYTDKRHKYSLAVIILIYSFSLLNSEIVLKNRALEVIMDEMSGRFTIISKNGNPEITSDNDIKILQNTVWPPTSFTRVMLDKKIHNFGSTAGKKLFSSVQSNSLIYAWTFKKIDFIQQINLSEKPGVVITYIIKNNGKTTADTGIKLCLDLASDRNSVFFKTNLDRLPAKSVHSGLNTWYYTDSAEKPSVFIKFFLPVPENQKSCKIQFDEWHNFSKYDWDFDPDFTESENKDTALGVYWNHTINSGETCKNEFTFLLDNLRLGKYLLAVKDIEYNKDTQSLNFSIHNNSLQELSDIPIELSAETGITLKDHSFFIKRLPSGGNIRFAALINPLFGNTREISITFTAKPHDLHHSEKIKITGHQPRPKINLDNFSGEIPLFFNISLQNIPGPASACIIITSELGDQHTINLDAGLFRESSCRYEWNGKDAAENLFTVQGLTYTYVLQAADLTGSVYSSAEEQFLIPVRPVENEKQIVYTFSDIQFDHGSSVLKAGAYRMLDAVVARIGEYPGKKYIIRGHTDNTGNKNFNNYLSLQRANSVSQYLQSKSGLGGSAFTVQGCGDQFPAADNSTAQGQMKNRRVEVIIEK